MNRPLHFCMEGHLKLRLYIVPLIGGFFVSLHTVKIKKITTMVLEGSRCGRFSWLVSQVGWGEVLLGWLVSQFRFSFDCM